MPPSCGRGSNRFDWLTGAFALAKAALILDSSEADLGTFPSADVLIVGSGPVGLTLAVALGAHGLSALVVEAGGAIPDSQLFEDLAAEFAGRNLSGLTLGRTRQIGGGLNLWGGQLAVLEASDLWRGESETALNWPIRSEELYGSLAETLELLGAKEVEFELHDPCMRHEASFAMPYGLNIVQTAWLKEPKLGRAFWSKLRESRSIHLIANLVCTGLEYDGELNRVNGIAAIGRPGKRAILKAKQTVLAAGSVENARLLMLPLPESRQAPWQTSAWLGGGFSEHLDATTASVEIVDRRRMNNIFDLSVRRGIKYSPKVAWSRAERSRHQISACGILFWPGNFRNSLSELAQLGTSLLVRHRASALSSFPRAIYGSARQILPLAYRYARQRRIGTFADRGAYLRVSTEQPTRQSSRIELSKTERDRFGMPRALVTWIRGHEELGSLRNFTYAVKSWLEGEGIGKIRVDPRLEANDMSFLEASDEGLHHSGTTRMALSMRDGVVDSELRVHGVRGLSVCGASVFPSSGYANPTLTAMVLALRLAKSLVPEIRVP